MSTKKQVVIGIVNSKGGSGKSTLVVQLAIAFNKKLHKKVLVVDVDDQGSSINWFERYRPENRAGVSAIHLSARYLKSQLRVISKGFDVVIIDSKGSRDKAVADVVSTEVITHSDFSVVPLVPAVFDEMAMDDFMRDVVEPLAKVKEIRLGVLLNRIKNVRSVKVFQKYLRDLDLPCFDNEVPEAATFTNGLGSGQACFEYDTKGKATLKFLAFFKELCDHLGVKKDGEKESSRTTKNKPSTPRKKGNAGSEHRI